MSAPSTLIDAAMAGDKNAARDVRAMLGRQHTAAVAEFTQMVSDRVKTQHPEEPPVAHSVSTTAPRVHFTHSVHAAIAAMSYIRFAAIDPEDDRIVATTYTGEQFTVTVTSA